MTSTAASVAFASARAAVLHALRHPLAGWALGAACCGAIGFALFGQTPGRSGEVGARPLPWSLDVPAAPDTTRARALLVATATWASQPAPLADGGGESARVPPRLVAVFTHGPAPAAVFEWPEGRRLRVIDGEPLDDGGPIDIVDGTTVRWRLASGALVEARLFLHPESRELRSPRTSPED